MADYDEKEDLMDRLLALGQAKEILEPRRAPSRDPGKHDVRRRSGRRSGTSGRRKYPCCRNRRSTSRSVPRIWLSTTRKKRNVDEDELDLDLSAGALDKSNDPVRLYLREMGIVPLLTREGEVTIAKRIERGQIKTHKAISRSPIAVERLIKIGDDLRDGRMSIRETVVFSEQAEISLEEDKAEEYMRWTLEGIGNIRRATKTRSKIWRIAAKEQQKHEGQEDRKSCLRLQATDGPCSARDRSGDQEPESDRARESGPDRRDPKGRRGDQKSTRGQSKTAQNKLDKKPRPGREKRASMPRSASNKADLTEIEEQYHLPSVEIKRSLPDDQRRRGRDQPGKT